MDFISNNYTLTINGLTLLIIFAGLLFVVGGTLGYAFRLNKKVKAYEQPKYGFLGKSIYPMITVALLMGGIMVANYSVFRDDKLIDIKASKSMSIQTDYEVLTQDTRSVDVRFAATPVLNNTSWGAPGDSFDIFWNIQGMRNYDMFEYDKSLQNPSGFDLTLQKGLYDIRILIVHDGQSFEFRETIEF